MSGRQIELIPFVIQTPTSPKKTEVLLWKKIVCIRRTQMKPDNIIS